MARYTGPVCKLCRREKMKLFLKGSKCDSMKCPIEKRPYPPGDHGRTQMRRKDSEYLLQLREKQKTKRIYGVLEKQFRNLYEEANRQKGVTGENLLRMLEQRLDNVAFRAGWGASRSQARQLVRHGHFTVNGKKVDIPSFQVRQGDMVGVRQSSASNPTIQHAMEEVKGRGVPEWLVFDGEGMSARIGSVPTREQINLPVQEQLIVELYSK